MSSQSGIEAFPIILEPCHAGAMMSARRRSRSAWALVGPASTASWAAGERQERCVSDASAGDGYYTRQHM